MEYVNYLERAAGAMSRRDYLSAMQYGLLAAGVPRGHDQIRCDAYMLLALTSLELGSPEDALAFAVGAHLAARWSGDEVREQKASSIVSLVMTQIPVTANSKVDKIH